MPFFGVPIRNGLPIGLGSVAGFGVQQFDPSQLFAGGTVAGAWYDPSDLSTMFTTDAGTTPVAMPGQGAGVAVGLILDKSGNGNHARSFGAGLSSTRPELRARVNLLERSEEFGNAYWTKSDSSIETNTSATTDPLGGNTADKFRVTTANTSHVIFNASAITLTINTSYVWSVYAKAGEYSWIAVSAYDGANRFTYFNLANGTIGTNSAGNTAAITAVGNGWYRCTVTRSAVGTVGYLDMRVANADNSVTFPGANTTDGIYIWGADLRPANIGANVPAYQRIADANTYDTSGFPLYLRFDGIDDSMYTPANLDLSGTDKVAVFAGVRKLSDAIQVYTELSADYNANNGTFLLWSNSSPNSLYFDSKGTTIRSAQDPATAAAPASFVLTGQGNISAPSVTLRKNGTQVASNTSSQGTGNYGSYPLFVGSRNNASFLSVANIYSLIIAGSAVSAGNISATEQWVAGKTGIQI